MVKEIQEVLPFMSYGGDYNPEQWSEDVWLEDARLMKNAGVNLVSVGIFSWAVLERQEDEFDFGWLDKVMDILHQHGVGVCLATATASTPAWFTKKYPDSVAVDEKGVPYSFGSRQHYSPSSPSYRKGISKLVRKLAERYQNHPALKMWHVNNEYGCHLSECYSEHSLRAFHDWLKEKYKNIEGLNEGWGTNFWSQRYNNWEEIDFPANQVTFYNPGQMLDYKRFMNDKIFELYKIEKAILREITPDIPIFTNFMYQFKPLNYFEWAKEMDLVTWDSYPDPREGIPVSHAFHHDLMRSLKKGQPFFLMEQVSSHVNWRDINLTKKPGVMRLWSYSTIAKSGDGIMFFQWRQGRAGAEKFHGAMIPHSNREDSRVYKEVSQLGNELKKLDSLVGTKIDAKVAIVFDWENWWAVELEGKPHNDLDYLSRVETYYNALYALNIAVDFVQPKDDLSSYEIVIAPMLYIIDEAEAANFETFVKDGGTLVISFFSGIADKNDRIHLGGYPALLRNLLGLYVDEFVPYEHGKEQLFRSNNDTYSCSMWTDMIRLESAEAIACYDSDWIKDTPAVTEHTYGDGKAYYVGTEPESRWVKEFVSQLSANKAVVPPLTVPVNVEVTKRSGNSGEHLIFINHNENDSEIKLGEGNSYTNLLTNEVISQNFSLKGNDVAVLLLSTN
ncbi:beta-galactosidase [Salipaludibacillus sp. CF4.18]|uniref:beta-galactosidase n=1 Tax=Salipaludibacillus sp. CF4.18 TaxID=3373081 RepID=UPI003EE5CA54